MIKKTIFFPLLLLAFQIGAQSLHDAAAAGDVVALQRMMREDVLVDEPDALGRTALMRAARNDRSEAVAFLLKQGADPDLQDNNGQSALFFTLQFGVREESLKLLLNEGADLKMTDYNGYTAAELLAARGKTPEYFNILYDYGFNPRMVTRRGTLFHSLMMRDETPLSRRFLETLYTISVPILRPGASGMTPRQAAESAGFSGYAEILKGFEIRVNEDLIQALVNHYDLGPEGLSDFLVRGADPDYRDDSGYTPCHYAVFARRPELLKILLENRTGVLPYGEDDPDLTAMVLFSPLDYSIDTALPLLELLLDGGLSVNSRFRQDQTLLSAAIMHSEQAARLVLAYGADPNLPDPGAVMPLMRATTRYLDPEGSLLEDLVAAGADISARNDEGWDVMTYALLYGQDISVVRRLLALGVDPALRDAFGTPTYFWAAAYAKDTDIIKLLIAPGVRGRLRDKDGWTPLMGALNFGNTPEAVAFLAGLEEDGRSLDACGRTLADFKRVYENRTGQTAPKELDNLIRNTRVYPPASVPMTGNLNESLRECVVFGGDVSVVRSLLEAGAEPGYSDDEGLSLLMNAAAYGDGEMVKVLLDAGASPFDVSPGGWTALHLVSWSSDVKSLELLLQKGMDPNVLDFENWTPLMWAARSHGSFSFVRRLLEAGARGDLLNYRKESALHLACSAWKAPRIEVLALLLQAGAAVNSRNCSGDTPLSLAAQMGYEEACRFLVEKGADPRIVNLRGERPADHAEQKGFSCLAEFLKQAGQEP